jgi:hypothetical protein
MFEKVSQECHKMSQEIGSLTNKKARIYGLF